MLHEIVELPTGAIDGVNTTYFTSKPYLTNTLAVYIDGQLKVAGEPDGWVEINPTTGQFQLNTAHPAGTTIHVAYTDPDPRPLPHPLLPINIQDLTRGSVVRIQLRNKSVFKGIKNNTAAVIRSQIPTPYRQALIVGSVFFNNFPNRNLGVNYQDSANRLFQTTINYKDIRYIEKQIAGTYVSDNVRRLRIPAYVPILGIY